MNNYDHQPQHNHLLLALVMTLQNKYNNSHFVESHFVESHFVETALRRLVTSSNRHFVEKSPPQNRPDFRQSEIRQSEIRQSGV